MGDLTKGSVIATRYRLDHLLGEGGMGAVWAATTTDTAEPVALKFLKGVGALDPKVHRRFYREARTAMAVKHPNVVRIHEVVRGGDGAPVMVMDLLRGESLAARLGRLGAMQLPTFAKLFLPVISAVGTAHALGIVHRDLKPDNIFLTDTDRGEAQVRVLDFGIAKLTATEGDAAQTAGLTGTGALLGTPYYMSPEQAYGEKDIDHRSDIWSLGIILYECLAGQRPIGGDNLGQIFKRITTGEITPLEEVRPDLPKPVTELVARMLAVHRKRRPEDLREVLEVLRPYADKVETIDFGAATLAANMSELLSEPPELALAPTAAITADAMSQSMAAPQPSRRWPLAAGAALVLSAGTGVWWFNRDKPPAAPTTPAAVVTSSAASTSASAPPPPVPASSSAPTASTSSAPSVVEPKVAKGVPSLPAGPSVKAAAGATSALVSPPSGPSTKGSTSAAIPIGRDAPF